MTDFQFQHDLINLKKIDLHWSTLDSSRSNTSKSSHANNRIKQRGNSVGGSAPDLIKNAKTFLIGIATSFYDVKQDSFIFHLL